ncbi:EscN/YscN/HrcN family type III secretion system ATPase [Stenotrophomonas sp. B1-1]|uniref:EscN/YscN/HrcN family type III secretion system ATPase n=1 Tax=Stenotrophomonas sp. B1-1 TaxID=2710648 RepID=UPI0013DC3487|nr:EscN/YscN/HrcN family type III secretion system ATPase [Stenotrophomonas sp. B1-1]
MRVGQSLWTVAARPLAIQGNSIRARLAGAALGEACVVRSALDGDTIALGTVSSVSDGICHLDIVAEQPLTPRCVVVRTGEPLQVVVPADVLGCVLDWAGRPVARFAEAAMACTAGSRPVQGVPGGFLDRLPVERLLPSGVRALDAFVPCGEGQRLGVFAPAGTGKTTLCSMLMDGAQADVKVVALIGERTREVSDFVQRIAAGPDAGRVVIVQATSDMSASARQYAAQVAMAVSEHFSATGASVLLVMDSVTRYARALRELALGRGEAAARRGYPASVFEALPKLFERAGRSRRGCISAYFTVLLEDEEDPDPIAEEVKSLLDGHVMLSRRLAQRGVLPAIDALSSLSRCAPELLDEAQMARAALARRALQALDESRLLRDLGEYRAGSNPEWDRAIAAEPALMEFIAQRMGTSSPLRKTWEALHAIRID